MKVFFMVLILDLDLVLINVNNPATLADICQILF